MERRDFLKSACTVCGIVLAPGILNSCSKPNTAAPAANFTLDLTASVNAALNTVGGSVYSNGVIVFRQNVATYTALSATCTHQGCTVSYYPSTNDLICPCHGGTFDANGNVLSGPPPSPLYKYTVTKSGNILTIKS